MMKASEYFNIPVEELRADRGDFFQRGDCVILDHTLVNCPFYSDLSLAEEATEHYRKSGYYTTVLLIETDYSSDYNYAVIAF